LPDLFNSSAHFYLRPAMRLPWVYAPGDVLLRLLLQVKAQLGVQLFVDGAGAKKVLYPPDHES
jgi:hypothetical protein